MAMALLARDSSANDVHAEILSRIMCNPVETQTLAHGESGTNYHSVAEQRYRRFEALDDGRVLEVLYQDDKNPERRWISLILRPSQQNTESLTTIYTLGIAGRLTSLRAERDPVDFYLYSCSESGPVGVHVRVEETESGPSRVPITDENANSVYASFVGEAARILRGEKRFVEIEDLFERLTAEPTDDTRSQAASLLP